MRILHGIHIRMPLERINLNVSAEVRRKLRAVAKRLKKTEAEVARDLLLDAIARMEREEFYREADDAMTPVVRDRLLQLYAAFEKLDDDAGAR